MTEVTAFVRELAKPFFEDQGEEILFVTECCDRILVSVEAPKICRTCKQSVEAVTLLKSDC